MAGPNRQLSAQEIFSTVACRQNHADRRTARKYQPVARGKTYPYGLAVS